MTNILVYSGSIWSIACYEMPEWFQDDEASAGKRREMQIYVNEMSHWPGSLWL